MTAASKKITILGGGIAGLAAGYYARKRGLPFDIFEESHRIGGNCITFQEGDFFFDSGAHRFHDRDEEITREIMDLLGESLELIRGPSQIYHSGKFIDFPLSPLNLLRQQGAPSFARTGFEVLASRLTNSSGPALNFEEYAFQTYGRTMANRFLLNYSRKLWGIPGEELSPTVASHRLDGLSLKTFFLEAFFGQRAKTEHLDGSFYYPATGIGTITEKMGESLGRENVHTLSRVTGIIHDGRRIVGVEINGKRVMETKRVISTFPVTNFLKIMDPPPGKEVLTLADSLNYRNLILTALFLERESVTENATIYFPGEEFFFTRVCEPKNRSPRMSPPGKTSLVAEIPCQPEDELWSMDDRELSHLFGSRLIEMGWIAPEDIISSRVVRLRHAYPVFETGYEKKIGRIRDYLKGFSNLDVTGRNGNFLYTSIHDAVRLSRGIVEGYPAGQPAGT